MRNGIYEVGDTVQYSPIIGGDFEDRFYIVRDVGLSTNDHPVAWLKGKSGYVSMKALRLVENKMEYPYGETYE